MGVKKCPKLRDVIYGRPLSDLEQPGPKKLQYYLAVSSDYFEVGRYHRLFQMRRPEAALFSRHLWTIPGNGSNEYGENNGFFFIC